MRLITVEVRKCLDTRAGFALVAAVAALTLVAAITQVTAGVGTASAAAVAAQWPVSVLLPVVALLAVTSEFTRRTALHTFALVPSRNRVVAAKAVAVLVLVAAATVLAVLVGWVAAGGGPVPASVLAQLGLVNAVTMLCGLAFGMLLLHSAPAIVAFYAVPIGWSAAGQLVPALGRVSGWLDIAQSRVPLTEPGVTAREWAMFATSTALWVALPAALGFLRVHRTDLS